MRHEHRFETPGVCPFTYLNDFKKQGGAHADGTAKARFRMRRCPGSNLIAETFDYHCRRGVTYRTTIKRGRTLTCAVDGREYMRAEDETPLEKGLFGVRTYATDLWVDNVRATALEQGEAKRAPPER